MSKEDDFDTIKMERQNSTLETTNQPFVSRTYEESPYAKRQWEYWVREQRLKRMKEFGSVIYGGDDELLEINELCAELNKNKNKMEPEEYQKQLEKLGEEEGRLCDVMHRFIHNIYVAREGFTKRIKEFSAFVKGVWYQEEGEGESLVFWIFHLVSEKVSAAEVERFVFSVFKEWLRDHRQLRNNWALDRRLTMQRQEELEALELPRLVSKRNKGLKWPLKDDQVEMFNKVAEKCFSYEVHYPEGTLNNNNNPRSFSRRAKLIKTVTPMHPFVDNKDKDTLVVGDYMRVSTNLHIKHKWFQTGNYVLGASDYFIGEFLNKEEMQKQQGMVWAKFVRENHPQYRDPQTRAEKNAKRIADIKRAHPDYF